MMYLLPLLIKIIFVSGASKNLSYFVNYDSNHFRQRRQTEKNGCILPPHPDRGSWSVLRGKGNPGDELPIASVITFECESGYKLSNKIPSVCLGEWSLPVPECEELCPPLYPSDTYDLTCIDKLGNKINCTEATHETSLEYTCKNFYETPFGYKKTLFCEDGKWDNQKPVCQPVCGKKIDHDKKPLIYGVEPNEKIEHPWIVAIYKKMNDSYENVCGGSILSQTVVVTAAHCVTNNFGDVQPKENYMIGVGKLYREYKSAKDIHAQYLELLQIIVPKHYKADIRKFAADIAVLVVKEEILLNEVTQPVCFTNMKYIHLHAGNKGEVSGWGVAQDGNLSEVLRTLVMPYKYETVCADELPSDWADKYNLRDKICAGFVNKSTSVCTGDSGSGLVFKYREDNRYYIHGVVSLGHQVEYMCNIQQNSLYTSVASYYNFVERLLTKFAPKVKDCILPPHPENGKWTTDQPKWKPGDSVPSSTALKVECDFGSKLSSRRNVECGSAHNLPTCDKLCPKLKFPKGTNYNCRNREGQYIDCFAAIDGSTLSYACHSKSPKENVFHNRTCTKGSWGWPKPDCLKCGKKVVDESGVGSDTPWNVRIYERIDGEEKYRVKCSGSIISENVIVTSAQCVAQNVPYGNALPAANFVVGAGTFYAKYGDTRDTHAEFSNITSIKLHPSYFRAVPLYGWAYNVATLKTSKIFTFNNFIQPICVIERDDSWWNNTALIAARLVEDDASATTTPLEVININDNLCETNNKPPFRYYFSQDKKCIEFKNKSTCFHAEDLGKGVVAEHVENNRYYLHAIVGTYKFGSGCDTKFWPNKVSASIDFINSALEK